MANSQIVRERKVAGGDDSRDLQGGARGTVVGDVMGDITPWRVLRDGQFEALYDEYYAKWRGFWNPQHKSYKTERSRLISPLTAMAVDLTSAEIIEAVLGREYFIDLPDDVGDNENDDVDAARKLLVQDLKNEGFIDEFASTVLNGCLYGTGITKIQILTKVVKTPTQVKTEDGTPEVVVTEQEVVSIKPVAIEPGSFVYDPSVANIDDMSGCAHEFMLPLTTLRKRQAEGVYYNDFVVMPSNARRLAQNRGDTEEGNLRKQGEAAFITEYYGLLSTRHMLQAQAEGNGVTVDEQIIADIPENDMTEVICTIANETHLLRVIESPLLTGERLMLSYQHEVVPGRFPGRGVCEKAANVQRAMDAEMRARIDGLAWSNLPMFAFDLTRMPPGSNMNAWPGKGWGTRGNPSEVIQEFKVSGPDQNSYVHMQELERMGQQATGAMDSQGLRSGMRDETATGSALAASSFIKRSKRTMFNIEGYMGKLVRRVLRLKMQFEPQRYPQDYEFQVRGSLGMMAREIEQQFMVNIASVLGPDSPAMMPLLIGIFEHSSSPVKSDVLKALKAIAEKKPTPEEEAAKKAQLAAPVAELAKTKAETVKLQAEGGLKIEQAEKTSIEAQILDNNKDLERIGVVIELEENDIQRGNLEVQQKDLVLKGKALELQRKALDKKPSA